MHALGPIGQKHGEIDTIVLGCTHYPFASSVLKQHLASNVHLLESGAPVARQTRRLLEAAQLLNAHGGKLTALATGSDDSLRWGLGRWGFPLS